MQHRRSRLKLTAKPDHARQMLRNMATSVILYETIRTTKKRAKVVQPIVERLITVAKKKSAHLAIRSINTVVTDKNASRKLMEVLRERFADRQSGFTRIKAAGARKGDGADLVDLSFVEGRKVAVAEKMQKNQKMQKMQRSSAAASPKKTEKVSSESSAPSASSAAS